MQINLGNGNKSYYLRLWVTTVVMYAKAFASNPLLVQV